MARAVWWTLLVAAVSLAAPAVVTPAATRPAVVVLRGGHLYAVALDGSRPARLTKQRIEAGIYGAAPAVSADGRFVAFTGRSGIWTMKIDGSERRRVTSGNDGGAVWSRDGSTIYFSRFRQTSYGDCGSIFAVGAGGGAPRRITDSQPTGHSHIDPAPSPDGTVVVFSDWDACEGGTSSPRLASVDMTGNPTNDLAQLPHNGYYPAPEHSCPAWSPDGTHIAFRHNADLDVASRDGSGERRLLRGGQALIYETPAWSPDGRWIAFTRYIDGGMRLLIVRPDGTGALLLMKSAGSNGLRLAGWLP